MDVNRNSPPRSAGERSWLLALFSLPFAGVGLGMLGFLVLPALLEWQAMKSWDDVPGELLSAELVTSRDSDGATYRAAASYRYSYGGNDYTADRVAIIGGADNIGSFQQDVARDLESRLARGEPVTVYVNPQAPHEAVLNRELRTGHLAMIGVFALVFTAAGLGLLYFALFRRRPAALPAAPDQPWLANSEWASAEIRSGGKATMIAAWAFSLFWCAICGVITFAAWEEFAASGNQAFLLILLFDLVGIALLAWAVHATLSWRRFGDLVLRLDPHPGSIGGDVGGLIDLPIPFDAAQAVAMTLSCQHVYVSGSGKNRSTKRDALWSDSRHFLGEPTADGRTRVHFRFAVPEGLPVSEPESDNYHCWQLDMACALPGVDLSRDFAIPVFATKQASRVAARVRESQAESLQHLETLMNLEQVPGGVRMDYRAGRGWKGGLATLLFGAIFGAVPAFIFRQEGFAFPGAIFIVVFGLAACGLLAAGLWQLGNRLRVQIDEGGLQMQRDLFGVPVKSLQVSRASLKGIAAVRGGSTAVGNKVTVHYRLDVVALDGTQQMIGDGFRGYGEAQRAAEAVGAYTRLPFLGEIDGRAAFAARKAAYLASRRKP